MRNTTYKMCAILFVAAVVLPGALKAQCTCDQTRLKNIMDNATITLLTSGGLPVSTLSPGTTYRVRITSTAFSCQLTGSGCSGINAPVTFIIKTADGAVSNSGNTIPPAVGQDVGSPNYSADILIKTLTGDDFSDQIFLKVGTQCFPSTTCGLLTSNALADKSVLKP